MWLDDLIGGNPVIFGKKKENLKSLSPEQIQEKIKKVAYELYVKKGCAPGNDAANWIEAEKLVKSGKA